MRDFYFYAPTSLDEALTLLDEHQEDGRPLAGGTAAVVLMKQNLLAADHLISLHKAPASAASRSRTMACTLARLPTTPTW